MNNKRWRKTFFSRDSPRDLKRIQIKESWHQRYWSEHDNDNVPSTHSLPIFCFDNPHQSDVITASACLHFGPLCNSHEASHYSCHHLAKTRRDIQNRIRSVFFLLVTCTWGIVPGSQPIWCEAASDASVTEAGRWLEQSWRRRGSLRGRARPETQPQWADTDQRQAWRHRGEGLQNIAGIL